MNVFHRQTSIHAPSARQAGGGGRCTTAVLRTVLASVLALATMPAWAQTSGARLSLTNTPASGADDGADDRYAPGTAITYTVVVDNPGEPALRGARVSAPLPQGVTTATWSCRASGGARCGQDSGREGLDDTPMLPPGSQVVYLWTVHVPAAYPRTHQALDVQARLALPDGTRATDPGQLIARDIDPEQAPAGAPAPSIPPAATPGLSSRGSSLAGASLGGVGARSGRQSGLRAGAAFPACGPDMYISQAPNAQTNTTLSHVDTSVIPFILQTMGTGSTPYNAIGFRPADNLIYGIQIGTNRLVRVYANGSTEVLGAVSGLPATFPSPPQDNSYNAGEIGTDGFLYVKTQSDVSRIYRINLTNLPSATATVINLVGGTVSGADFAWINDRLYTVNQNGTVAWIDPATGRVTTLPYANGALGNVGALFGTPNALFGSRNNPGGFYEFDLTTGQGTRLSGSPVVGSNDGAHCASAQIILNTDVGVTKTNTPDQGPNDLPDDYFIPGTNVTYQIVVSNRGPVGVANLRVRDALPAGVTAATWTCQIVQGDGGCDQPSGSGAIDTTVDLEFDETTRTVSMAVFKLTVSVPLDFSQSQPALTNTVTIELPDAYVDSTPNDNTATDSDIAAQADLRVVKSTPASNAAVGGTIQYTLVVDNLGPADVTNAVLRDTATSHLDCLTPAVAPMCTATGAAVCPSGITRAALFSTGITLPSLPANNGTVRISLECVVTP